MTEKRFENRLSKNNLKFLYQNPVWDNEKEDALNVFEMIDLLNELSTDCRQLKKEKEQSKKEYQKLEHRHSLLHDECVDIECERNSLKKDVESLEKENGQLTHFIRELATKGTGKIHLANGEIYKVNMILNDFKR